MEESVNFFQKWDPWSLAEREDEIGYLEFEDRDSGVQWSSSGEWLRRPG